MLLTVSMCAKPQNHRPRIYPRQLRDSIRQAKLLCIGFEDTLECKNAWKRVEALDSMYQDQCRIDDMIREAQLEVRHYDT